MNLQSIKITINKTIMKTLTLKIKGIDTIGNCIKVVNTSTYTDTITKNQQYNNASVKSIRVVNNCNKDFLLSGKTLFTQQDNLGSTFTATINDTTISANTTVDIPVYYNGVYKGTDISPVYTFTLNGYNITYNLNINIPDTLGTISDFTISLNNKQNYTFKVLDFTSHYSDIDGDTISSVYFYGNVNNLRYNNIGYVENTEIPISDIQAGKVVFNAPNQDALSSINISYKIKDSKGKIII